MARGQRISGLEGIFGNMLIQSKWLTHVSQTQFKLRLHRQTVNTETGDETDGFT